MGLFATAYTHMRYFLISDHINKKIKSGKNKKATAKRRFQLYWKGWIKNGAKKIQSS